MLYKPSALVSLGKVTLVSTLVASTFTPGITPPLGSVTRPVSVAVGPATMHAANDIRSAKRWILDIMPSTSRILVPTTPEYAARVVVLYQRALSGMIGVRLQVGVQELAACRPRTSTRALEGHKNRVDFRQNAGVLEFEHPTVLFLIVYKEDAEALKWTLGRPAGSPDLEGCIPPCGPPLSEVKGVEDQGLSFGITDTAKRPPVLALAVDVAHVDNVKIARAHQVMDIAAIRQ